MSEPITIDRIEAAPVEWLWRDRIPKGMITVVAGRRDQGKGLFAARVAADVSRQGGNVLYSAVEDDPARMTRPRLEAAGADLSRIRSWRFRMPIDQEEAFAKIVEYDIDLVVIDPFASHLSNGITRGSDNVRIVVDWMSAVSEATGCSWLVIEHMAKHVGKDADPGDAVLGGSSGLPSAARVMYLFGQNPHDEEGRLLAPAKFNIGPWPKTLTLDTDVEPVLVGGQEIEFPYLLVTGEDAIPASVLYPSSRNREAQVGRPPEKRAAAAEWLTALLFEHGPMQAGAVYEDALQAGISKKTVRRAADDMGIVRDPPGGGRKCTWDLPEDLRKALEAAQGGES